MHMKRLFFSTVRYEMAPFFLAILLMGTGFGASAETPKPGPDLCDREWDRIKSVPPMPKAAYEVWLQQPEPKSYNFGFGPTTGADMYYYFARIPYVIGAELIPSIAQREEWLQKAAEAGHKAAKAALLRLRYLGQAVPGDSSEEALQARIQRNTGKLPPRAMRIEYLQAARAAAEAGDPEFATVMMDTSRNVNALFHCRTDEKGVNAPTNGCYAQDVTQPIETRQWAEIAARGGNPHAKYLMCTMYNYGTYPHWGFEQNDHKAFSWCIASEATACTAGWNAGILGDMYEKGRGTPLNPSAGEALRKLYPPPRDGGKRIRFPQMTR